MDWNNFLLGVVASIVATAIWQVFISVASYVPSKYPDIRGYWKASYKENGQEVCERIHVKHQFGRNISGTIIALGSNGNNIDYSFKGEFVLNSCFKVSFSPKSRSHTDYGVALLQVNNEGTEITGGSVSFNFESVRIEPREVIGTRVNV